VAYKHKNSTVEITEKAIKAFICIKNKNKNKLVYLIRIA